MRLHSLTVTAFGPFPEAVEVDFDRVCAAGLFLIHGATGAGKTSLLDAICFALFADVPGARTRRGLASDHAVEGTRPSVRLDFTAGGRRFRIERSPEFSRPKKRGTGQTKVPAGVTLEQWRGGAWRAVSTRHDEVADVIDEALGMGLAQFAKVVVLPQGDVAAFLRATPEDRRALLERLFDISTFTGVETWLTEERRRCTGEVDDLMLAIRRDLDRLHDHLAGGVSTQWDALPVEALPAALGEHVSDLEAEVTTLLTAADEASQALAVAGDALHRARSTAETRRRGRRAQSDREAALACADEIAGLRVLVQRARAADAVSGHLAALEAAVQEEDSCRAELQVAHEAAGLAHPAGPEGDTTPGQAGDGTAAHVTRLAQLLRDGDPVVAELVHAAGEQDRARAAQARAQAAAADCALTVTRVLAERASAERELGLAQGRLAEIELLAAGHAAAEAAATAASRARGIAAEIEELAREGTAELSALIAARDDVLAAQETVMAARQRRLDGMAAELAAALTEGCPCPVCGSSSHPVRAVAGHPLGPHEVESAEESLTVARQALAGHERREAVRSSRRSTLREQLGDAAETDFAELTRREGEAVEALATTVAARSALPEARRLVAARATRLDNATGRAAETATTLAAARATLSAATDRVDALTASVALLRSRHAACPCVCDGDEDRPVAQVHRVHATLREAVDRVEAAGARHAGAMVRLRDQRSAAREAARARGFTDLEEARSARVEAVLVDRARARIADHEQTLAITAAILGEEAVAAAVAGPEPDVEAATESESVARRAVRAAQSAHSGAEARLLVLRSVQGPVCDLVARLLQARERAATVKDLADAATGVGGGNIYRMRLSSFVLAARLEKVVALANERLQRMDSGRYLLEHSDARVAGGARSGLDLRVLDQWTGRTRETASLSGGESFMVSLALALGLADAVREEAGGFDLGTLFVDEGFGSLDEESLEHVMAVLDGLREGGRAVGVVSHVVDLRARISHQVVVEKTATGSGVTVRTVA